MQLKVIFIFIPVRALKIYQIFENFIILLRFITHVLFEVIEYKILTPEQWRIYGRRLIGDYNFPSLRPMRRMHISLLSARGTELC